MTGLQYRQGDVLLVPVPTAPPYACRVEPDGQGRIVLARGHCSGHAHAMTAEGGVRLCEDAGCGLNWLIVGGRQPAVLMHEEHRAIAVEPGCYEIHRQYEYRPAHLAMSDCRVPASRWPRAMVRRSFRLHPGRIDLAAVRAEPDPDLRRVLIARFGPERIMAAPAARLLAQAAFGRLWRFDDFDGVALMMVEVRNATPEPDGSHRMYWLRVPEPVRSPRAAVAWTFGLTEADYHPAEQS
jgi:hypothetical protein